MTCKVILKPQCWLLVQNSVQTVQLLSSHFSSRAVSVVSGVGCCSESQQWRSQWGKLGLKIRLGNQVIWSLIHSVSIFLSLFLGIIFSIKIHKHSKKQKSNWSTKQTEISRVTTFNNSENDNDTSDENDDKLNHLESC